MYLATDRLAVARVCVIASFLGLGVAGAVGLLHAGDGVACWLEQTKRIADDATDNNAYGRSVSISGETAVVGASGDPHLNTGAAYVLYRNSGGPDNWGEVTRLTASDATESDNFGRAVSVSADTAVVGAPNSFGGANGSGKFYVFERNAGGPDNWGQVAKRAAIDAHAGQSMGHSIAIDGDSVAVGAPTDQDRGPSAGAVYVFERNRANPGDWGQATKLKASDGVTSDELGRSVAVHGDLLVAGATGVAGDGVLRGAAYVFRRDPGNRFRWNEVAKLEAAEAADFDELGRAVAVYDDTVVVGGTLSAHVFRRDAGGVDQWGEVAKLTSQDPAMWDNFGRAVAMFENRILVGARIDGELGLYAGAAYMFERPVDDPDAWGVVDRMTASDGATRDNFGGSVTLGPDIAIIGAPGDDHVAEDSGSIYVFEPGGLEGCDCHDDDGDGFLSCEDDCDDADAAVYPGAEQECDGVNNDCNAALWPTPPPDDADFDGDTYGVCAGDCDDGDATIFPNANETCNEIDDNCNGQVDDDALGTDTDNDGVRNACDNCVDVANAAQTDVDADATGDHCDPDDGVIYILFKQDGFVDWQEETGYAAWNSYRGDLATLAETGAYTQVPGTHPLAARSCGLSQPFVADTITPAAGQVAFYLTTGMTDNESELGRDSDGNVRPNDNPCP